VRGGSWYYDDIRMRCSSRGRDIPIFRHDLDGFRLALSPI
jgi:formylglycine-generating enzyme required for sulfatase activity